MRADASSFRHTPFTSGVPIAYAARYTPEEFERLAAGFVPRDMDDKWFIHYAAPFLDFHRSWTGTPVYRVELADADGGHRVVAALWAADLARGGGVEDAAAQLRRLIDVVLLGRDSGVAASVRESAAAQWTLEGHEAFSRESYRLGGAYASEAEAIRAARERLAALEQQQPTATSGGQSGLQDRVFVVRPDGSRFRVEP